MKKLIIVSVAAVVITALLGGGAVYAGKPTPTPTPGIIMETGSGYLQYDPDAGFTAFVFPPTFNPEDGTGGFDGVRHVSLTYTMEPGNQIGDVGVSTGCMDSRVEEPVPGLGYMLVSGRQSDVPITETLEFDAYKVWAIDLDRDEGGLEVPVYPVLSYNYTITYPSGQ